MKTVHAFERDRAARRDSLPPRSRAIALGGQGEPGGFGTQTPIMHWLFAAQSTGVWHGNAHFWNCMLQRCRPQALSFWQASASGPGVAMVPAAVGAGAAPVGCGGG